MINLFQRLGYKVSNYLFWHKVNRTYMKKDGQYYEMIFGAIPTQQKEKLLQHKGKWWTKVEVMYITDGADCYPWTEFFCIIPRRTITGERIFWEKAFKRKVWVLWGTGFHMEPETQYATIFEVLAMNHK